MKNLAKTVGNLPEAVGFRERVQRAEAELREAIANGDLDDAEPHCPVTHLFTPIQEEYGCSQYMRTIELPVGFLVVGKIHKHAHANVISKGTILVATEYGIKLYKAPCQFISKPGLKRAVFPLEDTVWSTVHLTATPGEENLDKVESEVISPSYEDIGLVDSTNRLRGVA